MSVLTPSTRLVVPLDGSEFATRAIPAADVVARTAGTGITLARRRGPATDPDLYLQQVRARLEELAPRGVELTSIPDPVSVADGLSDHLAERPALVLVAGGEHHRNVFAGVIRVLLRTLAVPVLLVPAASVPVALDSAEAGIESSDS